jgi:hypothetical protein
MQLLVNATEGVRGGLGCRVDEFGQGSSCQQQHEVIDIHGDGVRNPSLLKANHTVEAVYLDQVGCPGAACGDAPSRVASVTDVSIQADCSATLILVEHQVQ